MKRKKRKTYRRRSYRRNPSQGLSFKGKLTQPKTLFFITMAIVAAGVGYTVSTILPKQIMAGMLNKALTASETPEQSDKAFNLYRWSKYGIKGAITLGSIAAARGFNFPLLYAFALGAGASLVHNATQDMFPKLYAPSNATAVGYADHEGNEMLEGLYQGYNPDIEGLYKGYNPDIGGKFKAAPTPTPSPSPMGNHQFGAGFGS